MKLSDRKKKGIIGISLLFVALLAVNAVTDTFSANVPTTPSPTHRQQQIRSDSQRQSKPSNTFTVSNDFLTVNPFVDLNSLQAQQKKERESFYGNQGLPPIPAGSIPAPNVGSIPIPQLPAGAMPPVNANIGGKAKVSGILSGPEGNIAIMSDGKVVSVGDTYADGRIAYIGGDGIQFDDGHKLEYK